MIFNYLCFLLLHCFTTFSTRKVFISIPIPRPLCCCMLGKYPENSISWFFIKFKNLIVAQFLTLFGLKILKQFFQISYLIQFQTFALLRLHTNIKKLSSSHHFLNFKCHVLYLFVREILKKDHFPYPPLTKRIKTLLASFLSLCSG